MRQFPVTDLATFSDASLKKTNTRMPGGYASAHDFAREYLSGGGPPNQGPGAGVGAVLSPPLRDRIVNTKFALTFSGLYPDELTHRMVLNHLFQFGRRTGKILCEFAVGLEVHDDPAIRGRDQHFHVYACYDRRHDIRNRKTTAIFDIQGTRGDMKHPELVSVGDTPDDRLTWVGYVLKDDRALYHLLTLPLHRKRKVDRTMWARLALDQATTTHQGLAIVAQFAPDMYLLHRDRTLIVVRSPIWGVHSCGYMEPPVVGKPLTSLRSLSGRFT